MTATSAPICLAVLNPGGRDAPIDYSDGPGRPGEASHPPVNYHAYAAATNGAFFDKADAILPQRDRFHAVVVLIRSRVGISLKAIRKLKEAGCFVLASWKESGPYQIADQLQTRQALQDYGEILALADGILSPTMVLPPHCGPIPASEFERKTRFIPTPYPLEDPGWDFSVPIPERRGVMLGTRQFFVPTRNHLQALARCGAISAAWDLPVTVINGDKRKGAALLKQWETSFPKSRLRVIDRPLSYPDYLRLMASHRLVFQLDRSHVPGQVAGDAALCRILCAGGNSALERLINPDLADDGTESPQRIEEKLQIVLTNEEAYREAVESASHRAKDRAGFLSVAEEIGRFVRELQE